MTWLDGSQRPEGKETEVEAALLNRRVLLRVGLMAALALAISSALPPALIAPALSSFFFLFAMASGVVAGLSGERPFAPHLTRWDQSAMLMALGLVAGFFVDPEALEAAVAAAQK
ncbi:MAG: hypothetical protein MI920_01620 [Kiloniellales bacterium]|nr:hypothetical protein [Kiloniellales bacterium]